MTPHDERHEMYLRDILVGDISEESVEARKTLGKCPDCRHRLAELRKVQTDLDRTARERDVMLRDARNRESAPGLDRVETTLRQAAAGSRSSSSPSAPNTRSWRWSLPAAIAASLAIAFLLLGPFSGDDKPTEPDTILGTRIVEVISPVGSYDAEPVFRWRGELPDEGWYEVKVYSVGAPPGATSMGESDQIDEPQWIPTATEVRDWPQAIEWEVRVYDAMGDTRGSSGRIRADRS